MNYLNFIETSYKLASEGKEFPLSESRGISPLLIRLLEAEHNFVKLQYQAMQRILDLYQGKVTDDNIADLIGSEGFKAARKYLDDTFRIIKPNVYDVPDENEAIETLVKIFKLHIHVNLNRA